MCSFYAYDCGTSSIKHNNSHRKKRRYSWLSNRFKFKYVLPSANIIVKSKPDDIVVGGITDEDEIFTCNFKI